MKWYKAVILTNNEGIYFYVAIILTIVYMVSFMAGFIFSNTYTVETLRWLSFLRYAVSLPNEGELINLLAETKITLDVYVYASFLIALVKSILSFLVSLIPVLYTIPLIMKGLSLAHLSNPTIHFYYTTPLVVLESISSALISTAIIAYTYNVLTGRNGAVKVFKYCVYGFIGFITAFSIEEIFINIIFLI